MSSDPIKPGPFFLGIGQSNMSGRDHPPAGDTGEVAGTWLLDSRGRWIAARHPYNLYSSVRKAARLQGVSPAFGFAQRMRELHPVSPFGFVVNARGWTALDEWRRGGSYYAEAIRRCGDAAAAGGRLHGILWVQGETDLAHGWTTDYLQRLEGLIAELRADLGDVPFIAGEIHGRNALNSAVRRLPRRVPRTAFASSVHLRKFDTYHYDRVSATLLGQRMADAYHALAPQLDAS